MSVRQLVLCTFRGDYIARETSRTFKLQLSERVRHAACLSEISIKTAQQKVAMNVQRIYLNNLLPRLSS